jgi:hypothetical protein
MSQEAPKGKIWKTNGKSEEILVDDPDCFNEDGHKIKKRNKLTNFTPKKRKRK